ncbi:hypothetical protein CANTEDRAFT_113703 [Yamadazyma tenuis ATCC 10573]|nr:uncharacterized protein CANTEDRAFT_113703 [Yamadazyma tenuis ATCC 10573]EGV64957.1 hypothetical protein CANTEDRAFT_113703 [Yamadazyma tenuis ATCC 10573]
MPNGSVFIIFGSILLLLVVSAFLYFTITWAISVYKAKHQSEKYFYNAPLQYPDDGFNSSGSSVFERKSSFSNMSQLTLNQPLGRPYRNAKLENNRGSMFFSPTSDFILSSDTDSPTNFAGDSSSSFINLNSSALSLLEIGSGTVETPPNESKPKRPPSQYLEDLLAD